MAGGGDDSEQRDIPPTQKKLRDLRRQGQVPRSKDFETLIGLLFVVVYMVAFWGDISSRFKALIMLFDPALRLPFQEALAQVPKAAIMLAAGIILPLFAVLVAGIILGAMLDGGGFPINSKALSFDVNNINPVSGFKKIFTLKNLIELGKGLAVATILISANYILFRMYLNDVLWAPSCDENCVIIVILYVWGGSVLIGLILMIIIAAIDLAVSRILFKRDNKMTKTEIKREQKDEMGDPHVRSERKAIQRQIAASAGYTGIDKTSILMVFGDAAVGLVFKQGDTPAPIISVRTRMNASALVKQAALKKLPIVQEPQLVAELMQGAAVGDYIPAHTFNEVARVLIQNGVVQV